jgi:molybdopterin molybdotransferase
MLSVSDALQAIIQHARPGAKVSVPLTTSLCRILADNLIVPHDSPPFDKALMDGFAVCVPPTANANSIPTDSLRTFSVGETITAGRAPETALSGDQAARIMTGAPLPPGCNCVVPIEQTQFDESNPTIVTIPVSCLSLEANLMRRGTAAVTGSVLLKSGTRLQPQQVAALAEFGFADIVVRRQPSVAVLATGDELVDCSEPLLPGQIRNSNEPMLIAQIAASDCIPNGLGIARDDESQLFESIQRGLMNDVLLLTGGVSAGILDLVPQQLARAGVRQIFHGVHMKPGKPLWFGCYESGQHRCLVFGLPGNPVSSLVCFELFVRPALRRLSGLNTERDVLKAVISDSISVRGNRPVYQPVFVSLNETRLTAQPVPWSGSSDLRATVDANGMALLLPEHGPYDRGETVDCWLWGDQQLF